MGRDFSTLRFVAWPNFRSCVRPLRHARVQPMNRSVIGDSPRRREDARFITGRGAYIDDLTFDRVTRAVFVRSPHAHARIRSVDTKAAQAAPGVVAVLTAGDAPADGLKSLRPYAE